MLVLCEGEGGELFDLDPDPNELENLFDDPASQEGVTKMANRLKDWQERTGDTAPLAAL